MDILYYLATSCLVLFMVLATFDGFYLHIFKYSLFNRKESYFEHITHTIRAILFPLIIWMLIINESNFELFKFGTVLVFIDLIVLGLDAYNEKESREFMGGLPKWEYILHLFANGFHFSVVILALSLKLRIEHTQLLFVAHPALSFSHNLLQIVAINVIPGAVVLALLHFILLLEKPKSIWMNYRSKFLCC